MKPHCIRCSPANAVLLHDLDYLLLTGPLYKQLPVVRRSGHGCHPCLQTNTPDAPSVVLTIIDTPVTAAAPCCCRCPCGSHVCRRPLCCPPAPPAWRMCMQVMDKAGQLIDLGDSHLSGNVRIFGEIDPEWEVDPKQIVFQEKV